MSRNLYEVRIEMLKMMHQHIIDMGDEEIYLRWIYVGVPDEPSEDDYKFIAENDDEWKDTCTLFGKLTKGEKS